MKRPFVGLFLREGSTDDGLARHVEQSFADLDVSVILSAPDLSRLPKAPGKAVGDQLEAALHLMAGTDVDLVVVHRDGDGAGSVARQDEIRRCVEEAGVVLHLPVVPVRMTEAWLLLNEEAIREVAGNPNGRMPLHLPGVREVERLADPKRRLQEALVKASGLTGRRLRRFSGPSSFGLQRRQLLERLDRSGPVMQLEAWRDLHQQIRDLASRLCSQKRM